jgi:hypothetical protein
MEELFPALGAGITSTILCNPLDVIRINYQLKNKIILNRSIFTKGLSYGLVTIPTFWMIYFPMYRYISDKDTPKWLAAYTSCCLASTVTNPLWILRQRAQTDKLNVPVKSYYNGLIATYFINLSFTVQIPLYEYLKSKTDNSTFNTFINTSISKTVAVCFFYPLDTIRAKFRDGASLKSMKFTDYYKGVPIYLIRSIPYHTSVFCTFEFIKNNM